MEHVTEVNNKSTVKLTLHNLSSNTHSLFVDQLRVPEGIFIINLKLKIENEWVDGRIFDRKTAMWVFQKITEVRRDPAIIYYTSPTTLELRVYPFPANGIREVEIEFQYHDAIDATINIGSEEIDLNPEKNTPSIVTVDGTTSIDSSLSDFSFQRDPYLHFILDFSAGSKRSTKEYVKNIIAASGELDINQIMVSAANITSSNSVTDTLINIKNTSVLEHRINEIQLTELGGLWVEQALGSEILNVNRRLTKETFTKTPVFVIIQGQNTTIGEEVDVDNWSWLIPDMNVFYSYQGSKLSSYSAQSGKKLDNFSKINSPTVIALKQNQEIKIFPANTSSIYDSVNDGNLEIYNPLSKSFETASSNTSQPSQSPNWATYAESWSQWKTLSLQPSAIETQRGSFLQLSRDNSFLLPSTSFIVVESASQWRILERKEGQSIKNHSALEFEEERQTSEPPSWIILSFILLFIFMKDKRKMLRKI